MRLPRRHLDFMSCSARGQPAPYTPVHADLRLRLRLPRRRARRLHGLARPRGGGRRRHRGAGRVAGGRPPAVPRAGSRGAARRGAGDRAAGVHHRPRARRGRRRALHLRRDAPEAQRERRRPDLRPVRGRQHPAAAQAGRRRGRQVHRAGGHRRVGGRPHRGARARRRAGLEPGVPPRGPRRRGHAAPRPAGLRLPRRRGRHAGGERPGRGVRRHAGERHPQDRDRPGHRPAA